MTKRTLILFIFLSAFSLCPAWPESNPGASQKPVEQINIPDILEKVKAAYLSLDTLDVRGTQFLRTTETTAEGKLEADTTTTFEMKLGKPNLFKISWAKTSSAGKNEKGAVWSPGRESFVYISSLKSYFKADTDAALSSVYGIKKGFCPYIPLVFFYGASVTETLKDFKFEGFQPVGGDICYVISARSFAYEDVTLWISKDEYFLRKAQYSFDKSKAKYYGELFGGVIKEDQLIKTMGLDLTEDKTAAMKKMMNYARSSLSKFDSGQVTEIYVQTSPNPRLGYNDFVYNVPDKTPLQDSLYEYILKNSERLLK